MNHVCSQELPLLKSGFACKDWLCSVNKWLFILRAVSAPCYSNHKYFVLSRLHCTIPFLPWRGWELWGENDGNALNPVPIWYMHTACTVNRDWVPDISFQIILTLPHLSQPGTFSLSPEKHLFQWPEGLWPSLIYDPVTVSDITSSWILTAGMVSPLWTQSYGDDKGEKPSLGRK